MWFQDVENVLWFCDVVLYYGYVTVYVMAL